MGDPGLAAARRARCLGQGERRGLAQLLALARQIVVRRFRDALGPDQTGLPPASTGARPTGSPRYRRPSPVTTDHLDLRMPRQPRRDGCCRPLREQIDHRMAIPIHQERARPLAPAEALIITASGAHRNAQEERHVRL